MLHKAAHVSFIVIKIAGCYSEICIGLWVELSEQPTTNGKLSLVFTSYDCVASLRSFLLCLMETQQTSVSVAWPNYVRVATRGHLSFGMRPSKLDQIIIIIIVVGHKMSGSYQVFECFKS